MHDCARAGRRAILRRLFCGPPAVGCQGTTAGSCPRIFTVAPGRGPAFPYRCSLTEERPNDRDQAGRPDSERRRRTAVHLLLPPRRLHPGDARGLPEGRVAGRQGLHGADPDQLAHVCHRPPPDLPGHRYRHRVHQGRHGRALGRRHHERRRHDQRGRAPRLQPAGERPACLDPGRPSWRAEKHQGQHPGRDPLLHRPWRQGGSGRRSQRRRLREQVEDGHAQPVRLDRRLGTENRTGNGRRLVPAGHARHRHRRHRRESCGDGQGSTDGAHRHPRAESPRPAEPHRGAAPGAVRQGQPAGHRCPGPGRPDHRARRQDHGLPDPRRLAAGVHDPQLRRHPSRALRARRLRPGRTGSAGPVRLPGNRLGSRPERAPRQPRRDHPGRGAELEAGRDRPAQRQDAHRPRRRAQAHGRHAEQGRRAAGGPQGPLHLLRRPGRSGW